MSIVLFILKLLGILLLSIVGIVLIVLCYILFAPVRYRFWGQWMEEKNFYLKIHSFFHILSFSLSYEKEHMNYDLKCFGKKLGQPKVKIKKTPEKTAKKDDTIPREEDSNQQETKMTSQDVSEYYTEEKAVHKKEQKTKKTAKKKKVKRKSEFLDKLKDIKSFLNQEEYKLAIGHILKEIIVFFKYLWPKKVHCNLDFYTGEPDSTGYVTGFLALFPVIYQKNWKIYPDFNAQEAYVKAEFDCKGVTNVFCLLLPCIRIVLDKNCRKLYNDFM